MFQNFSVKLEERSYGLIPPLLLIYIFFQPFNHFTSIREIAFYSMLSIFLVKVARRGIEINWKDSTIITLLALLTVIFISILFSRYAIDSLNAFRKEFLYQIVVFFVIISEFRDKTRIRSLLLAVILGFITVTVIIFIKNPAASLLNVLEIKGNRDTFIGGYALNATFYLPFTVGYLLSFREKPAVKTLLWFSVLLEFILVLLYNSRAALAAVLVSAIVVITLAGKYRLLAIAFVVLLGVAGTGYLLKPDLFERYKTLSSFKIYTSNGNEGVNGRFDIWKGTIEVIKSRPVIGYGYGWKKLATVVREEGYLQRWKDKWPKTYYYFGNTHYGSANPHNLLLQLLFEIGILGLSAFILFWTTIILKVVKITKNRPGDELSCFVKYGVPAVLVSYFIINIANGLWGVITFVPAAITVAICELRKNAETT